MEGMAYVAVQRKPRVQEGGSGPSRARWGGRGGVPTADSKVLRASRAPPWGLDCILRAVEVRLQGSWP